MNDWSLHKAKSVTGRTIQVSKHCVKIWHEKQRKTQRVAGRSTHTSMLHIIANIAGIRTTCLLLLLLLLLLLWYLCTSSDSACQLLCTSIRVNTAPDTVALGFRVSAFIVEAYRICGTLLLMTGAGTRFYGRPRTMDERTPNYNRRTGDQKTKKLI